MNFHDKVISSFSLCDNTRVQMAGNIPSTTSTTTTTTTATTTTSGNQTVTHFTLSSGPTTLPPTYQPLYAGVVS